MKNPPVRLNIDNPRVIIGSPQHAAIIRRLRRALEFAEKKKSPHHPTVKKLLTALTRHEALWIATNRMD